MRSRVELFRCTIATGFSTFPFLFLLAVSVAFVGLVACQPRPGKPPLSTTVGQATGSVPVTPPATMQPAADDTGDASDADRLPPTIADLWEGRAHFVIDVAETGLPMGESDTLVMPGGELWSYVHASDRSAGVVDSCGAPVEFPGCVVIYRSEDDGETFRLPVGPVCQIACTQCPCTAEDDHIIQQQYPRVLHHEDHYWMSYEFQGRVMVRDSADGLIWSQPTWVAESLIWHLWYENCPAEERIGTHPFAPFDYECLRGGPPGLIVDNDILYVFMAQGRNPGAMGCFKRDVADESGEFEPCAHNPLFVGAADYGPTDVQDATANLYFDFRTISSAEVVRVGSGEDARFYMFYEGVRGPADGDPGDTQFGLGLARTLTTEIDGPWEKYGANPILVDLPGNIGLGHADLVEMEGMTWLYTSLDGTTRSRLRLVWR